MEDDALTLLREFIKTKKPVYLENHKILFGEIRFDKDTPVKFKNEYVNNQPTIVSKNESNSIVVITHLVRYGSS